MSKTLTITRRGFMGRCAAMAAAAGLPMWFVERELSAAEAPAAKTEANDRIGMALIGCGGQGSRDALNSERFGGEIVAVADVDAAHLDKAIQKFTRGAKKPLGYADFRKLLERKDVQAIVCGTPDHWHTLVDMAAARAGKDVYSEKPLTLTIDEGRRLVKVVKDSKIILQTGTQQRSDQRFRMACELVRNGRIGKLKNVVVWLPAGLCQGPFESKPVPEGLNWDFWLGQAPKVDYIPERCHTWFRYWYDYSGGTMTDWGAHHIDIGIWAIGQIAPSKIEGKALAQPIPGGYTAISEYEILYTYPDGVTLNVKTTKDDNGFGGVINKEGQRNGIRFEGTDGWIWVNRDKIEAVDRELLTKPLPDGAKRLYASKDHMGNFIEGVRTRKETICPAEVGHRSASMCHLGAIALRTGLKLEWDAKKEKFTGANAKAANAYVSRPMRKPYDYSFVA